MATVPKIIQVAISQLGQVGGQPYWSWYGFSYRVDWCAIFVSWCANQCGYLESGEMPRYAVVGDGAVWYLSRNRLKYRSEYVPVPGDVIFFSWSSDPRLGGLDHTGLVEYVENGVIHTIEGNSGDAVRRQEYSVNDSNVICFGTGNPDSGGITVSDYVISAIAGNFSRESVMNAAVWESLVPSTWDHQYAYDGIGGYGFGGFTNWETPHGRLWQYHVWCEENGFDEGDSNAQLQYIVYTERCWRGAYQQDGFDDFLASTSTDLYDLTDQFCRWWEGNPSDHMPERYNYAVEAYNYIQQHKNDDPNDYVWVAGNWYNTDAQRLNNVMCMYFWFRSHGIGPDPGPGPGPSPWRGDKMPIWMMIKYRLRRY